MIQQILGITSSIILKRRVFWPLLAGIGISLAGSPKVVAQPQPAYLYLDFTTLTLRDIPIIQQGGSFQASPAVIQVLGYDPSRQWNWGQTPNQYMQLGDFADSFQLQRLSLAQIEVLTGIDVGELPLNALALLQWQTLEDLVSTLPNLVNYPVASIKPLADLIGSVRSLSNITVAEALADPTLARLPLSKLDLRQYPLHSIPGLLDTPLEGFRGWQQATINQVPGLADVPFAYFPNPILAQGFIGTVDVVYGSAERSRLNTLSGSDVEGFTVPCATNCAHLEFSHPEWLKGKQWISGKYQQVRGGHGVLGTVNNGMEPTGRLPFGDGFKVVVTDVDEATGTAQTALYFRICAKGFFADLGCTPYFIGPVPWFSVQEEGSIFLGPI